MLFKLLVLIALTLGCGMTDMLAEQTVDQIVVVDTGESNDAHEDDVAIAPMVDQSFPVAREFSATMTTTARSRDAGRVFRPPRD